MFKPIVYPQAAGSYCCRSVGGGGLGHISLVFKSSLCVLHGLTEELFMFCGQLALTSVL